MAIKTAGRTFFVGTSGYASPASRDNLDARSGAAPDLLEAYASVFGAVELDSCFYRTPGGGTIAGWAEGTGEDFAFTIRVLREVTHVDRLGIPDRVAGLIDRYRALGDRLRCLLFTTPASFGCNVDRFRGVLDAVPSGIATAWEFRNETWWCPEVFDLLCEHGSAPVVCDTEGQAGSDVLPHGTFGEKWDFPFVYVRFRKERYRPGELMAWGEVLGEALRRGQGVYAFFRQSPEAHAYATALAELLTEVD